MLWIVTDTITLQIKCAGMRFFQRISELLLGEETEDLGLLSGLFKAVPPLC